MESARRRMSQSLSGYLCGTHSGALAHRRRARLRPAEIAAAHRDLEPAAPEPPITLGQAAWQPAGPAAALKRKLLDALHHPDVIELIVFGSQARGGVTGFSDVDAVLVVSDAVAEDPRRAQSLRSRVLVAQREVLAYQPMQHHGFEVVTPKLLTDAGAALELPAATLSETRSLGGMEVPARVRRGPSRRVAAARLETIVGRIGRMKRWPRHPWHAHVAVSMLELLPALYLQKSGREAPKWRSFDEARREFGANWWPYDLLAEVRESWPRRRQPGLEALIALGRNPWLAVAAWTRLPVRSPAALRGLLASDSLEPLQALAARMAA